MVNLDVKMSGDAQGLIVDVFDEGELLDTETVWFEDVLDDLPEFRLKEVKETVDYLLKKKKSKKDLDGVR